MVSKSAAQWYLKAAEQGDANAQFNLDAQDGNGVYEEALLCWWLMEMEFSKVGGPLVPKRS